MKVLVTGANGFIGSKVVSTLCDLRADVIATDLSSEHIDPRATFVRANFFEQQENWYTFFGKPDVCLHMAWRNGFVHDAPDHMGDLSSHFHFLTNLIDNGISRIAVMGSMHEIGFYVGAVDEKTPCNPMSQYGIAKNALRQSLSLYTSSKGCSFQWLRAFYIYGDDSSGNSVFSKIWRASQSGSRLFPLNSGKNQCDFIYIGDLAEQISKAVLQSDILGIINVCSGKPVSLGEEVEWYAKHYNLKINFQFGKYPDRPYDSPCIYGDNKKIKLILSNYLKKQN
jgi:nucleoside-diphosphate-sugar epimerase